MVVPRVGGGGGGIGGGVGGGDEEEELLRGAAALVGVRQARSRAWRPSDTATNCLRYVRSFRYKSTSGKA
jgi:hypothetical protein